MERVECTYLLS